MTRRRFFLLPTFTVPAAAAFAQQRQEIRDASHRLVGVIVTSRSGVREARDASYRLLGRYDPRSNQTRDASYRLVSRGDSLSALIWEAAKRKHATNR